MCPAIGGIAAPKRRIDEYLTSMFSFADLLDFRGSVAPFNASAYLEVNRKSTFSDDSSLQRDFKDPMG